MEVLGVVAAGEQFAKEAIKLVQLIKAIRDKYQGAPKEIEAWRKEIDDLLGLIKNIQASPELDGYGIDSTIDSCTDICHELINTLNGLNFETSDSLAHKIRLATKGLNEDEAVRKRFQDLQRLQITLLGKISLAQSAQGYQTAQDVRFIKSVQSGTEEEQCLQSLFITDPTADKNSIVTAKGERVNGTCEWITSTDQYKNWVTSRDGILWVSGGPAKGKTFVSIFLTQRLAEAGHVIYFFCDNKVASRNTAVAILRGLLYQLIDRFPCLLRHVFIPWKVQRDTLFNSNSFESLWGIFHDMLEALETDLTCVLDALDECIEESLAKLLRRIKMLFASKERPALRLVILSRRFPDCLERTLGSFPRIDLDSDEVSNQHDIDSYISARVKQLANDKGIPQSLVEHIQATFRERSEGTFLWVSFMADYIETIAVSSIENSLQNLPHGINQIYERILLQIKPEDVAIVAKLLLWVTLAIKPLTVSQLAEAVRLDASEYMSKEEICLSHIKMCGHFLQLHLPSIGTEDSVSEDYASEMPGLTKAEDTDVGAEDRFSEGPELSETKHTHSLTTESSALRGNSLATVTLVHQSAKDFLQQPRAGGLAAFQLQPSKGSLYIAQQLIRSMQGEWLVSIKAIQKFGWQEFKNGVEVMTNKAEDSDPPPLGVYAFQSWRDHLLQLDDASLLHLIEENKPFFAEESAIRDDWTSKKSQPVLHFACEQGLLPLVEKVLRRKKRTSPFTFQRYIDKESDKSPLIIAIDTGNDALVDKLLKFGATVEGETMRLASRLGSFRTFELLEATKGGQRFIKADRANQNPEDSLLHSSQYPVDIPGEGGQTPLIQSIKGGHFQLSERLVDTLGASTDHPDAIICAIVDSLLFSDGQDHVLKLAFSKWGLDINHRDKSGYTMLHRAFANIISYRKDHQKIYRFINQCLLLGADPSLRSVEGDAPFHCFKWFSLEGNVFSSKVLAPTNVVALLLHDGRLGIDDRGREGNTLLHRFVFDVFSPDVSSHEVSEADQFQGLTQLLDLGADRKLTNSQGLTARQVAEERYGVIEDKKGHEGYCSKTLEGVTLILDQYMTVANCTRKINPTDYDRLLAVDEEVSSSLCIVM